MTRSNGKEDESRAISRNEARSGLRRLQQYTGVVLLASAGAAVFLLATDGSLWIMAVSHAVGLIVVVVIDGILGVFSLYSYRRAYLASLAAAILGIILQLGDIVTAPQYNMTIPYFASYLFGLGAFDLLLALQGGILILGLFGRAYVGLLGRRKRREGRELNISRRNFARTIFGFGALVGFGVLLGSIKLPPPQQSTAPAPQVAGPDTPIANTNSLKADSTLYFEYPQGYPNILVKNPDGSLAALSLLCTHVCCECTYEASSKVIYCPCHGSVFDTTGKVLRGPAYVPLTPITLNVDSSGNIFPTGVGGRGPCV